SDVRTLPRADGLSVDTRLIVGAGGGGAGGSGTESFGGNGGDAGEPGEMTTGVDERGAPGTSTEGGPGGLGRLSADEPQVVGDGWTVGSGGAGGFLLGSTNGGGGGGGGYYGGGGGGGGCGYGGGGGGGGSSLVPKGGSGTITTGESEVVVTWLTPPTIDIASPVAGATITEGQALTASYSCSSPEGIPIAICSGSAADGSALDTAALGPHTLTVEAEDEFEGTAKESVTYTVVAPIAPKSSAAVPDTTISGHPKPIVRTRKKKATVKFSFSSDQPGATFECKL